MVDIVSPAVRSRMMAGIKGRDTKPEMLVRRYLHRRGFRFRIGVKLLPGRPDLVLRRYNAAIFVHGCFWHGHPGCRFATTPATRPEFWRSKILGNLTRDQRVNAELRRLGWRVAIVWECGLRRNADVTLDALSKFLVSQEAEVEIGMDGMRHALRNE